MRAVACAQPAIDPQMEEFKSWFVASDGFGPYIQSFFEQYEQYFNEYEETHALVYTEIHKEFSTNLEVAVDGWREAHGVTEERFLEMLETAQKRRDRKTDEIVGVLLGMMDYQEWISNIFFLKKSALLVPLFADCWDEPMAPSEEPFVPDAAPQLLQVALPDGVASGQSLQVTAPDGQVLMVTVPDGIGPGDIFNVTYTPVAPQ